MIVIDLHRAKEVLHIEEEFHEDDALIESMCRQAENLYEKLICKTMEELAEEAGGELPPSANTAIEFILTYIYNRGGVGADIERNLDVIVKLSQLNRRYQ